MRAQDWVGKLLLGRYRPVHILAEGGQGVVYLARTEGGVDGFVRPVVVKRILPEAVENENNTRLFLREAKLLSAMDHPGVLDIIDLDEVDGQYVMVLEYVRGSDIGRWTRFLKEQGRGFDWDLAAHACALVADALHYVHTRTDADGVPLGIIHRDVTPANILIDVEGAVKLADFGIARRQGDNTEKINGSDVVRGNFSFVAPEVFVGSTPTNAADIYSLGMVLHWLVTGTRAQAGASLEAILYKAMYGIPQRLDLASPDVPRGLADVVEQAIKKEPELRVPTAGEFAQRLRANLPADTAQRFALAAKRDLNSPEFAASGMGHPLAELDALWREYVPAAEVAPPASTASTASAASAASTASGARKGTPRWLWGTLGGVLVGLAGGLLWWQFRAPPSPEPSQFILVRGDVSQIGEGIDEAAPTAPVSHDPAAVGSEARADAEPEGDAADVDGSTPSSERTPTPRGEPAAATLTRTFSQRRGAIRQCADRYSDTDRIQVTFRFDVDATGRVRAVDLTPASAVASPLGNCLMTVARGTRFGSLPRAASFSIPVVVRRGASEAP